MLGEAIDDRDLIARTARGDRDAFARIVRRHQAAVYRLARWLVPDGAEDLLQETFLAALEGAAGFRGEGSVLGWLLTITRHAAARRGRRPVPTPVSDESLESLGLAAGWGSPFDAEQARALVERRTLITEALATLSEADRELLWWRDAVGLSGEETAAALGQSLPAMKSRLHRARLKLVAALREKGIDHAGS